jgi:Kef-type K+ transport system membrane component KefB
MHASQVNVLLHVLVTLAAIIVLGRVLGRLLRPLGQPQVIADILAGILLGPSLLGKEASSWLLPPEAAPSLGLVAQVGVILWMFLLGLETNLGVLRGKWRPIVSIAGAGMATPFLLGWLVLAGWLYPRFASADVDPVHFSLFIGVALSITAFPVLARILADRNLQRTSNGMTALACAAVGDVAAWCILAILVGMVQMQSGGARILLATVAFVAAMLVVVRPLVHRWAVRQTPQQAGNGAITVALLGCLLSAAMTEWIGIHALFGAFLFGLVIPHDCALAETLERRIRDVVSIVFLPAFFAYSGLRTEIGLVDTSAQWLAVGAIILVATLGKFGGVTAAARLNGFGWRDAAVLGSLMNARGLVELIVLNIGLDTGIISPTVYTMMVLMALATTVGTAPMIRALGVRAA